MLCSKAEEVHRMKLEVAIIERKEQLDDLIPFRVENALWGTEKFPPMYGYIGFIPQDAFYLKLICEEKNPLRVYTEINDPIYRDSVMEAYLMFEPVSSRANEENYLNFAVNANGVLHAEYGSSNQYRYVSDTCFKLLFQMGNNRSGKTNSGQDSKRQTSH